MIYWDTSAILPLYVEERATAFWESQVLAVAGSPKSCCLALTEFSFALRQKVLRREIQSKSAEMVIAKFMEDYTAGRWELSPLGLDVIDASLEVARIAYGLKRPVALRSLDGLHLGAARILKCDTIATDDARLAAAASRIGLQVLTTGTLLTM